MRLLDEQGPIKISKELGLNYNSYLDKLRRPEKFIIKHKNNIEYSSLLALRPSIRHAIRFVLIQYPEFKNEGLIVSEIENVFLEKGWHFTSGYISTGMVRNSDFVEVKGKRIKNGKEVNVYTTKK